MKARWILLLNLAVLVVNFLLSYGVTETQHRVLRTTARTAFGAPARPAPQSMGPRPRWIDAVDSVGKVASVGSVPRTRLVKYLHKLRDLDRLSAPQVDAVYRGLVLCCDELSRAGGHLDGARVDGRRTRELIGTLHRSVRARVEQSLRGADVQDRELLSQLVRIVISSAG